jgi:hypothetical protein
LCRSRARSEREKDNSVIYKHRKRWVWLGMTDVKVVIAYRSLSALVSDIGRELIPFLSSRKVTSQAQH